MLRSRTRIIVVTLSILFAISATAHAAGWLNQFRDAQQTAHEGGWTRAMEMFEEIAQKDQDLPEAAWNAAFLAEKTERWEICAFYYQFYLFRVPEPSDEAETKDRLDHCARRIDPAGALTVMATPSDATILVDGLPLAKGQLQDFTLGAGQHILVVKKEGYDTIKKEIDVVEDEPLYLDPVLKESVYYGTLDLTCDQDGAVVQLGGTTLGTTPLNKEGVKAVAEEKLLLTIQKDGFRLWQRYITVPRDKVFNLSVTMLPAPAPAPKPAAPAPSGAKKTK